MPPAPKLSEEELLAKMWQEMPDACEALGLDKPATKQQAA
jgi:hypothetical protein